MDSALRFSFSSSTGLFSRPLIARFSSLSLDDPRTYQPLFRPRTLHPLAHYTVFSPTQITHVLCFFWSRFVSSESLFCLPSSSLYGPFFHHEHVLPFPSLSSACKPRKYHALCFLSPSFHVSQVSSLVFAFYCLLRLAPARLPFLSFTSFPSPSLSRVVRERIAYIHHAKKENTSRK